MKTIKCIVCGSNVSNKNSDKRFCDLECQLVYNSNKEAINNSREYLL